MRRNTEGTTIIAVKIPNSTLKFLYGDSPQIQLTKKEIELLELKIKTELSPNKSQLEEQLEKLKTLLSAYIVRTNEKVDQLLKKAVKLRAKEFNEQESLIAAKIFYASIDKTLSLEKEEISESYRELNALLLFMEAENAISTKINSSIPDQFKETFKAAAAGLSIAIVDPPTWSVRASSTTGMKSSSRHETHSAPEPTRAEATGVIIPDASQPSVAENPSSLFASPPTNTSTSAIEAVNTAPKAHRCCIVM